jgi:hypothetical protein
MAMTVLASFADGFSCGMGSVFARFEEHTLAFGGRRFSSVSPNCEKMQNFKGLA